MGIDSFRNKENRPHCCVACLQLMPSPWYYSSKVGLDVSPSLSLGGTGCPPALAWAWVGLDVFSGLSLGGAGRFQWPEPGWSWLSPQAWAWVGLDISYGLNLGMGRLSRCLLWPYPVFGAAITFSPLARARVVGGSFPWPEPGWGRQFSLTWAWVGGSCPRANRQLNSYIIIIILLHTTSILPSDRLDTDQRPNLPDSRWVEPFPFSPELWELHGKAKMKEC